MTMTTDQEQLLERISNLESELDAARSQVSLLQADYEEAQEQVDTLVSDLKEARAERDEHEKAAAEAVTSLGSLENEAQQLLGAALGYPWYMNDQLKFPGATEKSGVCIGDNTTMTLLEEAADALVDLRGLLKRAVVLYEWKEGCTCDACKLALELRYAMERHE